MAVTADGARNPGNPGPTTDVELHDPVLEKLAQTNTFASEWPTLRNHLQLALLAAIPLFASRSSSLPPTTPPRPTESSAASQPTPPPLSTDAQPSSSPSSSSSSGASTQAQVPRPIPDSLLLSPTTTTSALPPTSPTRSPSSNSDDDLIPSTPGGLVLPPFPPLDLSRRRRNSAGSEAGPSGASGSGSRVNGHIPLGLTRPGISFDDEWDEELVIGGKKLPGRMEDEQGKKEVERLEKLLEAMEAPPFTIQRLAELLLSPTRYHSSLGKFLRAVEKALLVTSQWEPPSYNPATMAISFRSAFPANASDTSSEAGSISSAMDIDSTMPPGAATPMFSPIPFLARGDEGEDVAMGGMGEANGTVEEGLMSPLILGEGGGAGAGGMQLSGSVRSPTPGPEGVEEVGGSAAGETSATTAETAPLSSQGSSLSGTAGTAGTAGSDSIDPAHQSYLGRVDELDTGPMTSTNGTADGDDRANGQGQGRGRGQDDATQGTGEGGTMTPHGMSDRPVPISATTTVGEDSERRIAGMPRSRAGSSASLSERFVSAGVAEGDGGEVPVPPSGQDEDEDVKEAST